MKIGDVAKFQNGFAFKSSDFKKNGEFPVIKIKELKDGEVKFFSDSVCVDVDLDAGYRKFLVQEGDVLFALTGDPVNKPNPLSWVGRVSVYNHKEEALINQRVCKLLPTKKVNPKYIYYFFRDFENFYRLASLATGSASQANISTKAIENVEIDIPPINVQNRMIEYLDTISKKIEINNRINDNLVDQDIAIVKEIASICEKRIELKEICDDIYAGSTPSRKKEKFWATPDLIWFKNGEIKNNMILDSDEHISCICLSETSVKIVPENSILFAMYCVSTPQLSININTCTTNQAVCALVIPDFRLMSYVFYYIMIFGYELTNLANGAAQQNLNKGLISNYKIAIPELIDQRLDILSDHIKIRQQITKENNLLIQLRDTLLPKLMSGELDVSNIDF